MLFFPFFIFISPTIQCCAASQEQSEPGKMEKPIYQQEMMHRNNGENMG
jgi:hypothetical protein